LAQITLKTMSSRQRRSIPREEPFADRVGVGEQRHHHLRIVSGAAVAVGSVGAVEGLEVELRHRVDHEPGEVIGGQPVAQVRRQEQRLVAVAGEEVLRHAQSSSCKRMETAEFPGAVANADPAALRSRRSTALPR
jgi:hypothetical protein